MWGVLGNLIMTGAWPPWKYWFRY